MKELMLELVALVAVIIGAFWFGHHISEAAWQAQWSERDAADARAVASAERKQRSLEQYFQAEIDKVRIYAKTKIDQAAADAVAADAVADSLRESVRRLGARSAQACSSAPATSGGKAATAPGVVLADVFARADTRAGELAKAYDRARVAGLACEQAYAAIASEVRQ